MKLVDLEPRWLSPDLFIFRCPHCKAAGNPDGKGVWLSCKRVPLKTSEQCDLFDAAVGDAVVVPCRQESSWAVSGQDFATMSVTPSLDASASGHWHGHITKGKIA